MAPTAFRKWCALQIPQAGASDIDATDLETLAKRRKAYLDGVSFIRSQVGAFPVTPFPQSHRSSR